MVMLASLLVTVTVASRAHALGVFVPLYSDPDYNCSNWSPISSSIAAHPDTHFYLVIDSSNAVQSEIIRHDYDQCVPSLRPSVNPNTIVLGYVDTWALPSEVMGKIDSYAEWSSSSRPTGIFLRGTNASSATEYVPFISYAKDRGLTFIILSPLMPPNPDYYALGDLVITYSDSYDPFTITSLVISASTPATKQVVLLSMAPSNSSYTTKLSELVTAGVAAVYITDGTSGGRIPYTLPTFINEVVSAGVHKNVHIHDKDEAPTSSRANAVVGGILGTIIAVLILVLYLMWRRQRRCASSHDSPVHPFRSMHHRALTKIIKKISRRDQEDVPEERAGLTRHGNPQPEATRQRGFKIIEYLSPSEARRAYGRSRTNPPVYSTLSDVIH